MLRNVLYFFREAFKSVARNHLLSIATVSTITICILILGLSVLITLNTSTFLASLESDVEIMAYLDQDLDNDGIKDVRGKLESLPGIETITFVSREQALRDMQESLGKKDYDLESTLGKNPLPDSFEIKATDPHDVPELAIKIEKINGVYKVNYGKGVVEQLFSTARWVRVVSLVFIILLGLGAIFLIATTIRLAIFARRKEIYLMKLIGSTDWFIRWPFFIEGIGLGALGSLLSIIILATAYGSLLSRVDTILFMPLVGGTDVLINLYLSLFAAGAVLGIIGTGISINRFLDV
ncbi:cell division protein ftsx [hydrocarbon metagenome]|uniref:Cell division protein FtsX n=1 Tax=hydrocarbon metagenome TaxID=938273 RepID=A0A0W8E620_9ZZZZ